MDRPEGLTFGPDGNLYVASGTYWNLNYSILRFDGATGDFLGTSCLRGREACPDPRVTFGPDGNLYVGNRDTNSVLRYDGTTGAFLDTFASAPGMLARTAWPLGPMEIST